MQGRNRHVDVDVRRSNATFGVQTRRSAFKCDVRRSNATLGVQNAKISNGRLPPEDSPDRPQTLTKRVSDDSRHLIFGRPKLFFHEIFGAKSQHQIKNRSFWQSYEFLSVTGRFSTKNHPISPEFQVSTLLGEGGQERFSIFSLTFGPKPTYSFSSRMMI